MKNSVAGSLESNDVMIELSSHDSLVIELNSSVKQLFEKQILKVVNDVLNKYKLDKIKVVINDKGALDYTIKARMITAIKRGKFDE